MTERDPAADEKATKALSSCMQGTWTKMITNEHCVWATEHKELLFDDG